MHTYTHRQTQTHRHKQHLYGPVCMCVCVWRKKRTLSDGTEQQRMGLFADFCAANCNGWKVPNPPFSDPRKVLPREFFTLLLFCFPFGPAPFFLRTDAPKELSASERLHHLDVCVCVCWCPFRPFFCWSVLFSLSTVRTHATPARNSFARAPATLPEGE